MAMNNSKYSLGSLVSSTDGVSVNSSFVSMASTSSSGSLGFEIESEVGREALKEICCSALSRLLDFPDCQLEILLGYDEENNSQGTSGVNVARNITTSLRSMKRGLSALYKNHHQRPSHVYPWYQVTLLKPEGVEETDHAPSTLTFGSVLKENEQVTVLQLITHMNMFVSSEGLFRKSGNKGRMDQMVKGLQEGRFNDILLDGSYNAHDFASVLKQYFSELPEPLLMKRHLNAYLQAAALSSPANALRCLQLLMLLLPPVHRVVLQHLLDLLLQVTKSPDNRMDAHNLSLIFAPTLFLASRSESLPPEDFVKLSQLLAYMINSSDDIFEVPPEVQVVAERYCRKRSRKNQLNKSFNSLDLIEDEMKGGGEEGVDGGEGEDEDVAIDLYSNSCKRECLETFHETGKERAMDEVAKLYEMVKNMPEGPQKARFMKRFESASKTGCTPTSVPKQKRMSSLSRLKRSLKRNKENATPKISSNQIQLIKPCFQKGSLASEFDQVDGNVELTGVTQTFNALQETPCKAVETGSNFKTPGSCVAPNRNILKPPSGFKTPGNEFATPESFKTPGIANVCKVRMIPTNSALVTDV